MSGRREGASLLRNVRGGNRCSHAPAKGSVKVTTVVGSDQDAGICAEPKAMECQRVHDSAAQPSAPVFRTGLDLVNDAERAGNREPAGSGDPPILTEDFSADDLADGPDSCGVWRRRFVRGGAVFRSHEVAGLCRLPLGGQSSTQGRRFCSGLYPGPRVVVMAAEPRQCLLVVLMKYVTQAVRM